MSVDEEYPFAAYYDALEAAVATRGRVVARVFCAGCQHPVADVYDTPRGALYYAEVGLPGSRWLMDDVKDTLGAGVEQYPTATSTDLVEWPGERPERTIAARCRDDGDLVIALADLVPKVAEYRRSSKVQRVTIHPPPAAPL